MSNKLEKRNKFDKIRFRLAVRNVQIQKKLQESVCGRQTVSDRVQIMGSHLGQTHKFLTGKYGPKLLVHSNLLPNNFG